MTPNRNVDVRMNHCHDLTAAAALLLGVSLMPSTRNRLEMYRAGVARAVLAAVARALAGATAVAVVDEGEDGGLHCGWCGWGLGTD